MFGNAWFGDWMIKFGAWAVGLSPAQLDLIEKHLLGRGGRD
jgi:hypothetical protein